MARNAVLDGELESHLQMQIEDNLRAGLTPEQARPPALIKLGGVALTRETFHRQRGVPVIEIIIQDVRYGLRRLIRSPGFTCVALVSLALGIGANTAIFSLMNSLFFRPLPISRPEEVVSLQNRTGAGGRSSFFSFSYPNYRDLRDRNTVFSGLIGYRFAPLSVSREGVSEKMWGYLVTGNYFDVLGVNAVAGRMIKPDDDRLPGAHPVVIISHRYWRREFLESPASIGQDLMVNGRSFRIIGVAPKDFFGTQFGVGPDFWFPMAMQAEIEIGTPWLEKRDVELVWLQGRLKPGADISRAEGELNSIALQLEREYPDINEGKRIGLAPLGVAGSSMRGSISTFAAILMAVVAFALMLACLNLANLLLARSTERRKEIAVRLSIGASRSRLIWQLMSESMLLAIGGGVLGLLLANWLVRLTAGVKLPIDFPFQLDLYLDRRVFAFTCGIAFLTGILFGLVPALHTTRINIFSSLKLNSTVEETPRSLLKSGLIVFQVALSLVLLIGGGLMLRALQRAQVLQIGMNPNNAVEISFDLRLQGYDSTSGREFRNRLLERVRSLPDVQYAGTIDLAPIDLHFSRSPVFIEGRTPERIASAPRAMASRISEGYLTAMGVRLLEGRDFTTHDDVDSPRVAIVNQTFARSFWPGQNPLGKRFSLGSSAAPLMEVVGVIEDGKYSSLGEVAQSYVCRPVLQSYVGATTLIVRTTRNPQNSLTTLRNQVQQLDERMPISARLLTERMFLPLLPMRIAAAVFGGFGILALALAAIGIYGVMSHTVQARTRDIGIRIALGAKAVDVVRHIMWQGFALTLFGVGIGVVAALGLTRMMKSLLLGVSSADPLIYIGVSFVLMFASLLACYLPARHATKVDPIIALRSE